MTTGRQSHKILEAWSKLTKKGIRPTKYEQPFRVYSLWTLQIASKSCLCPTTEVLSMEGFQFHSGTACNKELQQNLWKKSEVFFFFLSIQGWMFRISFIVGSIDVLAQEGAGDAKLFPGEILIIKLKRSALAAVDKIR